ncbi:hypothetical protein [Bradyrhizobium algeriense]|uniref:hypothetical protein n=1 Tax=Bradyrhizobium algeriense TaxID=634784 RepID=UPI0011AE76AA|nr:hypothetical protein [Bradyrhizobium algeriense]
MAFSLPAVAELMKKLGTTTRQTKREKVASPLPLRDFFGLSALLSPTTLLLHRSDLDALRSRVDH